MSTAYRDRIRTSINVLGDAFGAARRELAKHWLLHYYYYYPSSCFLFLCHD